jgi:hypothetical protein
VISQVPWNVRLNEHFILSDFLYSDSIIRRGLKNQYHERGVTTQHGRALARLLGAIADEHGHLSIGYGYINHDISMRTVKWKNPADPSYHRWDLGAACDFIAHDWLSPVLTKGVWKTSEADEASPMMLAREIANSHEFSRMITYSESPSICVAANLNEETLKDARRAFYEYRYQGEHGAKPMYVKHPEVPTRDSVREGLAEHGWVGQGHPSHHGKGRLQYQHVRIGKYLTLLECLRCPFKLYEGVNNRPPNSAKGKKNFMKVGFAMSRFIEWYYHFVGQGSISVISGHNSITDNDFLNRLYEGIGEVSKDWGHGEGSMIFAIHEEYGPEFVNAWQEHGTEDYHLNWEPTADSLTIKVTWRTK